MSSGFFTRIALLFLIAANASALAAAQPVDRTDAAIGAIVRGEMQKQHIPGVALAVLRNGSVVLEQGHGLANMESNIPVRNDTAFSIGSLSKQFLAAGIMVLQQDGKIDLDASVRNYLQDAPTHWQTITIRHLLTHTSGIIREAPGFDPAKIQPDIDVIRTAYSLPLRFTPGEKYEYSNTGYFILAEIIARQSEMSWPDFCRQRIFLPAGMNSTRTTSVTDLIPNRSGGYEWRDAKNVNVVPFLALRPSGAFVSTLVDMEKWDRALAEGQLLTRKSRDLMWTPGRFNNGKEGAYGFGWRLETVNGHYEVGHGGSLPGFRSYFTRYPQAGISVIVLTNEGDAEPRDIARAVAQHYLKKP